MTDSNINDEPVGGEESLCLLSLLLKISKLHDAIKNGLLRDYARVHD